MTTPENLKNDEMNEEIALFPPGVLLLIAGGSFLLAFGALMLQQEFGVISWGFTGFGVLSLFAWGMMAPEQLRDTLRGRALQYGGTGVLVTVIFLAALTMIYIVVREQGWRTDLSTQEIFSLTEEARDLVATLAADPTLPEARIIGFYSSVQGGQRDRVEILLQDIEQAAGGRISYEFIDPDRNPQLLELYGATDGQLIVTALTEEGEPDIENAELLPGFDQQIITDALIKVTAGGEFQMLVLSVEDGALIDDATGAGMAILAQRMQDRFSWSVEQVTIFDLQGDDSPLHNAVDGTVLVIPGGSAPLPDEALTTITEYLDTGGDLVLYPGFNPDGQALAVADNLNAYLLENFGVQMRDDFILEPQLGFELQVNTFGQHPIASNYTPDTDLLVLNAARPITVADEQPENVQVSVLASTADTAYIKTDLDLTRQLTEADVTQAEDDEAGNLPVIVAAENTETGARVVLMGSDTLYQNAFQQLQVMGVQNLLFSQDSLLWAVDYDSFQSVRSQVLPRNTPVPVFAEEGEIQLINSVVTIFLPIGVLLLGVFVWWVNREREHEPV